MVKYISLLLHKFNERKTKQINKTAIGKADAARLGKIQEFVRTLAGYLPPEKYFFGGLTAENAGKNLLFTCLKPLGVVS